MSVSSHLAERVDLVVDAAPCALVVLERDGSIGSSNPAARQLLGGSSVTAATFVPDPGCHELQSRLRAGERPSVLMSVLRTDGETVDVQVDSQPVFDSAGDYLGAVCWLRDVTGQLAAATQLEDRQRLMELLAHAVRDINADLEPQSVLDRVCARAADLVGAVGAELAIIEGDEAVCVAEWKLGSARIGTRRPVREGLFAQAVRTGQPAAAGNIEPCQQQGASSALPAHIRSVVCVPAVHNGASIGALYVLFEAKEPRLSVNELDVLQLLADHTWAAFDNATQHVEALRARARQQAVVDATADGMALVDAAGNVASWNAAAESLTGIPAHEAIGAQPPFAVDPDRAVIDHKLGSGRWLEIIVAPVAGTGERVLDFRDITQSKLLEEARDLFLATTSHELRTPITVVQGFAGTLLHRWTELSDAERHDAVSTILHRTEALAALVDQLLLGSSTGVGFAVDTTVFGVGDALREALAGFEALSARHTLVLKLPPGLPPVAADRGSLDNVVAQLVENAIKYSPDGGEVRVAASHEGDQIVVRVSDDGVGIDSDDAELIFERFYQAGAGDRRNFGGLGLGLYIVRRLVEAQAGSVRAYGTPGLGTTVEFTLPVASQELDPTIERTSWGIAGSEWV